MALIRRTLEASISLAETGASFKNTGGADTVTLSGLRMSARINKAGGYSDSTMDLTIYGMTKDVMNRLSTLGMQINLVPKNGITLSAGDDNGVATVFVGYIIAAYIDFRGAPNVGFHITAHTMAPAKPAKASSFKGATSVSTIMSGLAAQMGLKFENSGVDVMLQSPYFSGDAKTQARAVVEHANINWNSGDNGVLAIWPKNGKRGDQAPLISPSTGMIGYPTYDAYGIVLRTVFNPAVGLGGQVVVESDLQPASGTWNVYSIDLLLDAQVPHGSWEMSILAYNPTFPTPVR